MNHDQRAGIDPALIAGLQDQRGDGCGLPFHGDDLVRRMGLQRIVNCHAIGNDTTDTVQPHVDGARRDLADPLDQVGGGY